MIFFSYRDFFSKSWTQYLDADAIASMRASAQYTVLLKPGLRLISMNTQWNDQINWYLSFHLSQFNFALEIRRYLYLMEEQYLPALAWLESTLEVLSSFHWFI